LQAQSQTADSIPMLLRARLQSELRGSDCGSGWGSALESCISISQVWYPLLSQSHSEASTANFSSLAGKTPSASTALFWTMRPGSPVCRQMRSGRHASPVMRCHCTATGSVSGGNTVRLRPQIRPQQQAHLLFSCWANDDRHNTRGRAWHMYMWSLQHLLRR
jgi:hypothetical protein